MVNFYLKKKRNIFRPALTDTCPQQAPDHNVHPRCNHSFLLYFTLSIVAISLLLTGPPKLSSKLLFNLSLTTAWSKQPIQSLTSSPWHIHRQYYVIDLCADNDSNKVTFTTFISFYVFVTLASPISFLGCLYSLC